MGSVAECGLKGYETRHAANQAKKTHHDKHVRAFQCRKPGCPYWHLGELPQKVVQGEMTAGEFYAGQENVPAEKRRSTRAQLRRWRLNTAALLERDARVLADMLAAAEVTDARAALRRLPKMLRQLAEQEGNN